MSKAIAWFLRNPRRQFKEADRQLALAIASLSDAIRNAK